MQTHPYTFSRPRTWMSLEKILVSEKCVETQLHVERFTFGSVRNVKRDTRKYFEGKIWLISVFSSLSLSPLPLSLCLSLHLLSFLFRVYMEIFLCLYTVYMSRVRPEHFSTKSVLSAGPSSHFSHASQRMKHARTHARTHVKRRLKKTAPLDAYFQSLRNRGMRQLHTLFTDLVDGAWSVSRN